MPMTVASDMPPMTTVPRMRRETEPAPVAVHSGRQPKMKASAVITMGRKRSRAAWSAASAMLCPARVILHRELDDQNGILRREADEHDEADCCEDVVFKRPHAERDITRRESRPAC